MRTIWTIIVWVCYLTTINYYILTFNLINQFVSKLLYLWPGFITLIFCAIQVYIGLVDYKHKVFISLCLASIAGNFLIMIMYFQFGIDGYFIRMLTFNGSSLITTIFVLISGFQHDYFKQEEN